MLLVLLSTASSLCFLIQYVGLRFFFFNCACSMPHREYCSAVSALLEVHEINQPGVSLEQYSVEQRDLSFPVYLTLSERG